MCIEKRWYYKVIIDNNDQNGYLISKIKKGAGAQRQLYIRGVGRYHTKIEPLTNKPWVIQRIRFTHDLVPGESLGIYISTKVPGAFQPAIAPGASYCVQTKGCYTRPEDARQDLKALPHTE